MKNYQRGMIWPIILIVAVLVVGGGVYYFSKNNVSININTSPKEKVTDSGTDKVTTTQSKMVMKEFKNPSGLFRMMYPADWQEDQARTFSSEGEATMFYKYEVMPTQLPVASGTKAAAPVRTGYLAVGFLSGSTDQLAQLDKQILALQQNPTFSYTKEDIVIDGQKGYKYSYKYQGAVSASYYMIPLTLGSDKAYFSIVFGTYPGGKAVSEEADVIKSIKFDLSKLSQAIQIKNNFQDDARAKATLSGLRASGELYYDVGQSYAGMCVTKNKDFAPSYSSLVQQVGVANVKCSSDAKSYAITAKLKSGSFYCIDSTGYGGKASMFQTANACSK